MGQSELKGFLCINAAGKEYTVIEYCQPKGSVRFFKTKGLEVIQINSKTFKIVKTGEVIKSPIPI